MQAGFRAAIHLAPKLISAVRAACADIQNGLLDGCGTLSLFHLVICLRANFYRFALHSHCDSRRDKVTSALGIPIALWMGTFCANVVTNRGTSVPSPVQLALMADIPGAAVPAHTNTTMTGPSPRSTAQHQCSCAKSASRI